MLSTSALGQLVDDSLAYDATTASGLTNHLPMALVAKAGLGATSQELSRFAKRYGRRLVPLAPAREKLTRATWRRAVGRGDTYAELVAYFNGAVRAFGVDETVSSHLDVLVGGLSGAAFHGVIRLAYALDVNAPDRVASGLAYFAASATTLGPLDGATPTSDDPEVLFQELSANAHGLTLAPARLIGERMSLAAVQPAFSSMTSALAIDETTPRRLARAALKVYASTNDFTALHGVTGLEALARLRPYVSDHERFDRASYQALAAAYLSIGAPEVWSKDRLEVLTGTRELDASEIRTRAARSDDEHVSKIVYSASRLESSTADDLYWAVAERAVRGDASRESETRDVEGVC